MKLYEIKKQPHPWLLTEAKNTHLEHLEDLIFNQGYQGATSAIDYVESLRKMLADGTGSTASVTVKWDGSPAVFCGIDPQDGRFFVGTKSIFAKEPKLCKTAKNIQKYYEDKPELAEKLYQALKHLPKLNIGGIVQGDLMFTEGDVDTAKIKGDDCYVFTPNTITYAVPTNTGIGERIGRAKLGIIFHTSYEGPDIANLKASYGVNTASFTPHKDVWFDDATYKDYTGVASLTPQEDSHITKMLFAATQTLEKVGKAKIDAVLGNRQFSKTIKPFVNQQVRKGEQITDPNKFLKDFMLYYTDIHMKDIEALKGGIDSPAARARLDKIKEKEQWIADNANTLTGILAVYKRIIEMKMFLINKLSKVDSIGTFQKTSDGYRVTSPEGFVALGHDGGAVKLVDRLEFSRTNFMKRN